jgi:ABC-type molybdate transport system ATPase subunit
MDYTRLSRIEHGSRPAPGLDGIRTLADLLSLDMVDLLVAAGTSREVMEHLLWAERLQHTEAAPGIQVYNSYSSPLLAKNTFPVTVQGRDGALCRVSLGGEELAVFSFAAGTALVIAIPPEAVMIHCERPKRESCTADSVLPATVKKIRRLGQVTNLVLAADGFELNTLHNAERIKRMNLKKGEAVFASVQATAIRTKPKEEGKR